MYVILRKTTRILKGLNRKELSLFFCIPAFFFFIITILLLPLLSSTPILNVYIVIAGSDFLFFYFDTKNNFRFSKTCICFEIKCKEDPIRELIVYIVEAKQNTMLQFVAKMIMILFIITREKKGFIMVCFDYTYSVEISNTTPHLDKKMVGPYIYKIAGYVDDSW